MLASKSINIEGERRNVHITGKVNLRDLSIRAFDKSLGAHMAHDTKPCRLAMNYKSTSNFFITREKAKFEWF